MKEGIIDMNKVNRAFERLLKEIDEILNMIREQTDEHLHAENFDKVKTLAEYAERLKDLREKVKALQGEYQTILRIFSEKIPTQVQIEQVKPTQVRKKKVKGKLKKGLRTPEEQFIIPILEAIIELGGRAKVKDVLERVYDKMKKILNSYDEEPLRSRRNVKRWVNTARWARQKMVDEGLLAKNSPRGIWEITEKGRKYYYEEKKKKGGP
ncbi:MAG: winged helix-turn-helix domain-containing protein [Thermocrinis sp.]|uniref:winged helix-turn-helix domain-containing protein n=1 Tax=Thermocrinis sp. TaxID=2024383 RepID=UPI003C026491